MRTVVDRASNFVARTGPGSAPAWARGRLVARVAAGLAMFVSITGTGHAGTLVSFNFNHGSVQVDLFDEVTPVTVANFLGYVNSNAYANTVIHRSETLQSAGIGVIQGGGLIYNAASQSFIELTGPQIVNEQGILNKKGTLSMARLTGLNTASTQWFINTEDANGVPSFQYAVFGQVVGNMRLVERINGVNPDGFLNGNFTGANFFNNGSFLRLPVTNYTQTDYSASIKPVAAQMAVLNSVTIVETHPSFQNPISSVDVNNDGFLTNIDAFNIIDSLRLHGSHAANLFVGSDYRYRDPSGNGVITPLDARRVIDQLILLGSGVPAPQASALASPLAMGSVSPLFVVPEPSSIALAAIAALALAASAFKRRLRRRG